jgi:hypothetical protein
MTAPARTCLETQGRTGCRPAHGRRRTASRRSGPLRRDAMEKARSALVLAAYMSAPSVFVIAYPGVALTGLRVWVFACLLGWSPGAGTTRSSTTRTVKPGFGCGLRPANRPHARAQCRCADPHDRRHGGLRTRPAVRRTCPPHRPRPMCLVRSRDEPGVGVVSPWSVGADRESCRRSELCPLNAHRQTETRSAHSGVRPGRIRWAFSRQRTLLGGSSD